MYLLKFFVGDDNLLRCEKMDCGIGEIPYNILKDGVGGYIQFVYHVNLGSDDLALVVNEEGLLDGLKPTFWLYSDENNTMEKIPLVGNVLVVKLSGEDVVGLSEDDVVSVKSKVMVDKISGRYFLPLNDDYIRKSNEFLNNMFGNNSVDED